MEDIFVVGSGELFFVQVEVKATNKAEAIKQAMRALQREVLRYESDPNRRIDR